MAGKAKRRSEGDLPSHRFKARRNTWEDEDGEDESSGGIDGVAVLGNAGKRMKKDARDRKGEKGKKKGRFSEPAGNSAREVEDVNEEDEDEDEDYEDPGREESNEFLELDNLERKKKRDAERAKALFMEKFMRIVQRDGKDVRKLIGEMDDEFSVQNEEFLEKFRQTSAFAAPLAHGKEHDENFWDFALLRVKGQDLIEKAMEVTSQLDKLIEKDVADDFKGLLNNDWDKEDEEMARMLDLGKTVGWNKFECVLNASKQEVLGVEATEVEKKFFSVGVEEGEGDGNGDGKTIGWGKEAKRHERASRKLLKGFEGRG